MAESRMQPFPTALYAGVFLLTAVAFNLFHRAVVRQSDDASQFKAKIQAARHRDWIAMVVYALAIPAAYLHPAIALALILGVSLLYFAPDKTRR
jgi:uncharacterized membrane protein